MIVICGITAISRAGGKTSIGQPAALMRLACLAIEERGTDATGMGWTDPKDDRVWYWKEPQRARYALHNVRLPRNFNVAIGHTRAATQGNKSKSENNHPVVDDGIVLVHNGMISNDWALFREHFDKDYIKKAEVDSQVIASMLAHRVSLGIDSPGGVFELLKGSAAVAWLDSANPDVLNLARIKERPLTIGRTRSGDLIMSSTPGTMANLALWSNIKIRDIREIEEGVHLRVLNGEIIEETTFKVPTAVTTYVNHNNYGGGWKGNGPDKVADKKVDTVKPDAVIPPEVDDWESEDDAWWANIDRMSSRSSRQDDYEATIKDERVAFLEWNYHHLRGLHQEGEVDYSEVLGAFNDWQSSKNNSSRLDFLIRLNDEEYAEWQDLRAESGLAVLRGEMTHEEMEEMLDDFIAEWDAEPARPQLELVQGETP